jgi:hypothetical protein
VLNPEDLLPCSQELVSGAYHDPEESREEPHTPFTKNNIVLLSTGWGIAQYSTQPTSCTIKETRFESRERQLLFNAPQPIPMGTEVKSAEG